MGDGDWQEVTRKKRRSVFDRLGFSASNSINVYVSNFPSHLTVRELSNICGKKGKIADVFIANHKNKLGQMFGFCRFNGVDNSQNLIDSLNGVWIGKLRLHANIARFDKKEGFRPPQANVKKFVTTASTSIKRGDNSSHSFVNVVKGVSNGEKMGTGGTPVDDSPTVSVSQEDKCTLELAILGCHKDFRSIANSRIICRNEGFSGVDIKYLGGLWVLFVFKDKHVRDKFINHEGIQSWFTSLEPWYDDFVLNERLIWLEIEGVPIRAWHNDTFKSICRKWGEALFIDDSDSSNRFSIRLCIKSSHNSLIFASTTVKLNGVTYAYRVRELCSWTPNFAPEVVDMEEEGYVAEEEGSVENSSNADGGKVKAEEEELMGELFCNDDNETPPNMKENLDAQPSNSDPFELEHLIAKNGNYKSNKQGSSTPKFPPGFTQSDDGDKQNDFSDVNKPEHLVHHESKSIQSSQVKDDEVPRKYVGVSMIQQVEDTIKVGIALGFNMDGCQDMLQKMIADMGDDIETKLLRVDLWSLRQKDSIICADNYVAAQGTWIQNGLKIMFIAVYAPQSLASKIVLWSTLSQLISNWDGHAIVMGDFNEVREAADMILLSWLECEGFYDLVVDTWKSYDSDNQMKKEHQDRLSLTDAKVDQGSASSDDLTLRISSLKILGDIERKEASNLAQKAKVKWALEGDENTSFFHGSLKKKRRESASRPIIEDVDFKQISVEQQEFLECDVSNEKIKKAVWNCGSDRAPGPDGFTFKFIKTFWDVIQNDMVRFVGEFFQSSCFPKGCNSSFIALIPKIGDAKCLSDFRPISLIGCQYKIIGKLLANRLSTVIGSCVSFEQSAFIKGRNFLDGPLVLNECMSWYRKRSKALMVFKVDFEKAFNSLRWDYLDVIMEKLGFGFKWRMWIFGCLKNFRASILINGSPTPELDMFNGIRQGDPLSPFLFILAMEGLHALVSKAVATGVNVLDEEVSSMALVLGCGVAKLPMMYLGVPIGCNMGRCDNWKRVVQKFESKMNRWKAKLLSVGGRLSLIKAVLGDSDDKKITWVKWNSCLASKAMGGLGIGSTFALNVALLFKWIWRFRTTSNSLWVNVIKDIHGHDGGIGSGRVGKLSHSPWNSIIRTVSHLQAKGIDLLALCGRSLGDGNSISYWGDKWCGTRPLKDSFPRVYALDDNKLCTVAQRINIEDWSFVLRRPPRGGAESYQLDELIQFTRDVVLSDSADAWTWELDKSGYSVSSARIHIDEHTLNGTFTSTRWLRCIPIKVNVFIWRLTLDKLSTLVNMDRKGIDVDSLLCLICKAHVENVDHLFFSCEMAHDLWGLMARWCNLDIPEVSNITEWFSWLDDAHVSKSARVILEGIASTMLWFI
ncbi:RNA-directed DNA polymerase, eukaryota, reverse transcriptase zinc-binding domain protein [Tanacetum coccineum]